MNRNLRALCFLLAVSTFLFLTAHSQSANPAPKTIHPGTLWLDTDGHPINAHGGGVLFFRGRYYWYGEHKLVGKSEADKADGGIHAYSSNNLVQWKDEGLVLSVDYNNPASDIAYGCILERPKVLYNEQQKVFRAYFKLYLKGGGYTHAYVGMATATSPAGPFHYQGKAFAANPEFGSGDFALFTGEDGQTYHLAVRKPDRAFVLGPLSNDGTISAPSAYQPAAGVEVATEAPALLVHDHKFFLLGSGSSGWTPNPARAYSAESIRGPYTNLGSFVSGTNPHNGLGSDKTFGAQISFVLPVHGKKNAYIAIFDLWQPKNAAEAMYIWLPLTFEKGAPIVHWMDEWDPETYFR